MCGIAAILSKNGESSDLDGILHRMLDKIKHRGDSLFEKEIVGDCALGTNRLAIVDRPNGQQPMTNESKSVFVIQNGEIFNHDALKHELESKGHIFQTDCDTETLAHLWEEYGPKLIEKIDSEMFAIALYDKEHNSFFAGRDPLGVKPLYYAYDSKGGFFLASEIKQLSQFDFITEIHEFPPGTYLYNEKFTTYFKLPQNTQKVTAEEAKKRLKILIEDAIKKRVNTDLPIGIFLSGGVDSSLLMEIATRNHSNVTAIILGTKSSPDFKSAVRICKERNWKHVIVRPPKNFHEKIEEIIYYLESYEPNIVRHAIANDLVSMKAKELGLKIVLVGEGLDELFGGYNEFTQLSPEKINLGCKLLLESMSNGHMMRVDKLAMKSTIEIRSPYYDTALINYALTLPGEFKVKQTAKGILTKAIFRELALDYLPKYIAYRYKAPFANGAGMNIGSNYLTSDGIIGKKAAKLITDKELNELKAKYPNYHLTTKEEAYYFTIYKNFAYTKFKEGEQRLVVKDNLAQI